MKRLSIIILFLLCSIVSFSQTVTGTGTVNYVPKFTGTSALGNSLIFDNGTRVGIGTSVPGALFQVGSASSPFRIYGWGETGHWGGATLVGYTGPWAVEYGFEGTGGTVLGGFGVTATNETLTDYYIGIYTNQRMSILSGGNVGIGVPTPAYKLDVNGTARFTGDAFVNGITLGLGGGAAASNSMFGFRSGSVNTTGTLNSFFGYLGGAVNTTGTGNSFFGFQTGAANTSGNYNNFFGFNTGASNTTGLNNNFLGASAGFNSTTGNYNNFIGSNAGYSNTTGRDNTFFGLYAGISNTTASNNVYIGNQAGNFNITGANNTFLGYNAGYFIADGVTNATMMDNSILVGYKTKVQANNQTNQIVIGHGVTGLGSNTTVLGNSSTVVTAIYGNLLLGKTAQTVSTYMLDVNGFVRANKLTVNTTGADFVFEPNYKLPSLKELELFVQTNHHLPGIAPAKEMQEGGIELGENQTKLLQKVEELTLYAIDQDKNNNALQIKVATQTEEIKDLKGQLLKLAALVEKIVNK